MNTLAAGSAAGCLPNSHPSPILPHRNQVSGAQSGRMNRDSSKRGMDLAGPFLLERKYPCVRHLQRDLFFVAGIFLTNALGKVSHLAISYPVGHCKRDIQLGITQCPQNKNRAARQGKHNIAKRRPNETRVCRDSLICLMYLKSQVKTPMVQMLYSAT